jgi:hypothetical protein
MGSAVVRGLSTPPHTLLDPSLSKPIYIVNEKTLAKKKMGMHV